MKLSSLREKELFSLHFDSKVRYRVVSFEMDGVRCIENDNDSFIVLFCYDQVVILLVEPTNYDDYIVLISNTPRTP